MTKEDLVQREKVAASSRKDAEGDWDAILVCVWQRSRLKDHY